MVVGNVSLGLSTMDVVWLQVHNFEFNLMQKQWYWVNDTILFRNYPLVNIFLVDFF